MKFNLEYVKKRPVMFGAIFVVFGLIVYLMLQSGPDETQAQTNYVTTGPSEAQLAASVSLGHASIAANAAGTQASYELAAIQAQANAGVAAIEKQGQIDIALATIGRDVASQTVAADERVAVKQLEATLAAQMGMYATTLAAQQDQNATNLAFMKDTNATAIKNAEITSKVYLEMNRQQQDTAKLNSALSVIPTLKKKHRDDALNAIIRSGSLNTSTANNFGVAPTPAAV